MKASEMRVFLFDGERRAVQIQVNEFLRTLGNRGVAEPDIVAFEFNYQGPEYDGIKAVEGSASHGIMIVAQYPAPLTPNQRREEQGLDPVSRQPEANSPDDDARAIIPG